MTSVDASPFVEARKREHELNHRQREILDLLVQGKTNGEIAERLEMTLDGAKWNVSEILTKLGLGTREEAAEYWRWRRGGMRRVSTWLRGLFTPLVGKVALGAGLSAVAAVALFAAFTSSDGESTGGLEPFYLEANFFGLAYDERTGEQSTATLRWWYQDRDRQRIEFHDSGINPDGPRDVLVVSDGSEMLVAVDYGTGPPAPEPGYITLPLRAVPADLQIRPWIVLGIVGPPPVRLDEIQDFDDYHTAVRGQGPAPRGIEEVIGRPALVRVGSFAHSDSPKTTYWLDEETLFILRIESVSNDGRRTGGEVTALELDARHDESLFELTTDIRPRVMPGDSTYRDLVQWTDTSWAQAGPSMPSLPAGMFEPNPQSWVVERSTFYLRAADDATVLLNLRERERTLTIRQDYDEEYGLGVGLDVPVRGGVGRINDNAIGNILRFWEDGVRVELTSPDLSHDELIAVAEGMARQ